MVEPTPEVLVVIASRVHGGSSAARSGAGYPTTCRVPAKGDYHPVIAALRDVARVTGVLPPRLVLVAVPAGAAPEDALARLTRLRGVAGVYTGALPAGLRETFTPTENLFVDAWLARSAGKQRPGEGLPWDADGRRPPHPPE